MWFFFFVFPLVCDSSLMHVVCVCALVVVDWFCLSFFFDVTLVSFLMVYLVCEVCLFLQVMMLDDLLCSAVLHLVLCEHCLSSSLVLIISSSCVVEEEETGECLGSGVKAQGGCGTQEVL